MAKKTLQVASVDAGNGGVNAFLNGQSIYFPSVRAAATGDSLGLGADWEMQYNVIRWRGQSYIVGDDVLRISKNRLEHHIGSGRYGKEFHQFLVAAALRMLGVTSGDVDLSLFAPPGLFKQVHGEIAENFLANGGKVSIQFREDKAPCSWRYRNVTVWPEGMAIAAALMLNDKGQPVNSALFDDDVLIMDVGVYTLDVLRLKDANFNPETLDHSTFEDGGVDTHMRQPLLRIVKAASEDFVNTTIDDIDQVFRSADKRLEVGGSEIDLRTTIDQHAERYAEWIANNVISRHFSDLRGINLCIVGGGMGPYIEPYLNEWYGAKIFNRSSNPIASARQPGEWNAWGGYKLAVLQQMQKA